jgi:hypothetical protein
LPSLIALVAFTAVIAVYSTIVTVVVEGLQKLCKLRSSGMSEMLRSFYDRTLATLQPTDATPEALAPVGVDGPRASPQARQFVKDMSGRNSSESLRFWYMRNWPIIRSMFGTAAEHMSTLQFIERLAKTPQGAALAGHDRSKLRAALTVAAYEFERLGEIQASYFRARAKVLSVIVGLAVAVFVNLDAISLYRELVTNNDLASRLTLLADSPQLSALQQSAQVNPGVNVAPTVAVSQLVAMSSDLKSMGLPVGRSMFPHCEGYLPDKTAEAIGFEGGYRDPRCGEPNQVKYVNPVWSQSFWEFRAQPQKAQLKNAAGPASGLSAVLADASLWVQYRIGRIAAIGDNPQTFIMWFLGIVIGGGLLGLGAPFWFNLFGKAAILAAPAAKATLARATGYAAVPAPSASAATPSAVEVRRAGSHDPRDLERGFLIALGRGADLIADGAFGPGSPPPGQEYGVRPPVPRSGVG